ncbi:MAG: hypothetical protein DMF88_14735 [Acidobacteria bacterium]|nr:MAG: hypothetical protein DMF88_14735 [Acidobacteriota bacterium]
MNLLVWTLAVPLATAAIGALNGPRKFKEAVMIGGLAITFVLCIATARQFLGGAIPAAFGEALRVDGLSALVVVLSGFVGLLSGTYAVGYLRRNEARNLVTPRMRREIHGLLPAYVFATLLVSMTNNLGIMWIAVELTTLASVFLITFHDRDTSLEAAWKFLVLGSLGLGFALLGIVLLFAAGEEHLGEGLSALNWTRFMQVAPSLHPFTLRLGVVFALIGYGTKAGLAPMQCVDGGLHAERRSVLRAAHSSHFQCGIGPRVFRRPPAHAGSAVGVHRDSIHSGAVESEAAAGVFEH